MDVNVFRQIILVNELGGDERLAFRFSDPDGVRTRKSGYSFGVCQFDINNNPEAILCLRQCGFTTDEIATLKAQTMHVGKLEAKLAAHADIVARWDHRQLVECLEYPLSLCDKSGILLAGRETLYHLADYHNQFYMSRGGKMHKYLMSCGRPVDPTDVLHLKLSTAWGRKRPDDVHRRYNNISRIVGDAA